MKKIDIRDFNIFVKNIKYHSTQFVFAANSVKIFFCSEDDSDLYSFWIDPPWRIVLNNKIITNSFNNYPFHENYDEDQEEQESRDWEKNKRELRR